MKRILMIRTCFAVLAIIPLTGGYFAVSSGWAARQAGSKSSGIKTLPAKSHDLLPKSTKVAAFLNGGSSTLYVYDAKALLKGIKEGKFTVAWDGHSSTAKATEPASASPNLSSDYVFTAKVVSNAKVSDFTKECQQAPDGALPSQSILVCDAGLARQKAGLGPMEPIPGQSASKVGFRANYRELTYLTGKGDQWGQEWQTAESVTCAYLKPDGKKPLRSNGEIWYGFDLSAGPFPKP